MTRERIADIPISPHRVGRALRAPGEQLRAWLAALMAVLAVFATEQVIEHFAVARDLEQERNHVLGRLSTLRARLEGGVNANISLVRGLAAVIAAQPRLDQAGFAAIARGVVRDEHVLRVLAAAPGMVVSLIYPLAGNEAVVGLDYRRHPQQSLAALRARDSRRTVIAGPLRLVQGGMGIVVREPVFVPPDGGGDEPRFWGLVSAVIDSENLYRQAGLHDSANGLSLGLRAIDDDGVPGPAVFGDEAVFDRHPVTLEVLLPGGSWQLAALPLAGWGHANGEAADLIRLMGVLAALAAAIMAFILVRRTQSVVAHGARLQALLNTVPDLIWMKDPDGAYVACNPRFEQFFGVRERDIVGRTGAEFLSPQQALIGCSTSDPDQEWAAIDADGRSAVLETINAPVTDATGSVIGVLGVARDITARKEHERELRRLNATLSALVEGSTDAIFVKDCDGRYIVGNKALADLLGRPINEVLGQDDSALFAPALAERFRRDDLRVMASGVVETYEEPVATPDATHRNLTTKGPLFIDGRVQGVFGISRDITERKRAELELRRQRDILDRTSRLALVGGWEFDVATLEGRWTAEAVRIHDGDPQSSATVEAALSYYQGESLRVLEQVLQDAIGKAEPFDVELEMRGAGGRVKYVRTIGRPVVADGKVVRVEGAIQDITKRREAEAQARRGELVLDSVFEALPDLFFLIDADGFIRDYRASRRDDLYLPPEAFVDRRVGDCLPPAVALRFDQCLAQCDEGGGPVSFEYALPMPSGTRHFEARLSRLPAGGQCIVVVRNITERIAAERELDTQRRESVFLANLVERSSQPVAVGLPDGRMGRCNQAFLDLVGYTREEIASIDWARQLTPTRWLSREQKALEQLRASRIPVRYEKEYIRKDGSLVPVEIYVDVVSGPEGVGENYFAFVTDISARLRVDAALRESETRYRQLFENGPAPMVVYEKGSLRVLAVNLAFVDHYGYSSEEARGLLLTDLYTEAERPRVAAYSAGLSGLAYTGEWQHLKKDRCCIVIEARSHDIDYQGHAARVIVINDVTERKTAEALLEKQRRLLADSQRIAHIGSWELDLRSGALAWTEETYRIYGIQRASFGSDTESFMALLLPEERPAMQAWIDDLLAAKSPTDLEFRVVRPDGAVRIINGRGTLDCDHHGQALRAWGTAQDITERKRLEDEIRQFNAELESRVEQRTQELAAANKELETFTYSVSHDLKAPLRGIDGYSRLLLEDHQAQLDEEGRLFLANVQRGVAQMNELIEDLLAYSRMERRSVQGELLALDEQVARVLEERRADIEARGMTVELDLGGLAARADRDGLAIVIRNLVDNALKFTKDTASPRLCFRGRAGKGVIVMEVSDNGIGFDMRFHDRIFEIFQRLQRAEDYPGTGIGLAIVRKAMQRMGGSVRAESAPGEGTRFYLEFPQ